MATKRELEMVVRNVLDNREKEYKFKESSRGTLFFTMKMPTHVMPLDICILISDVRIIFQAIFPINVPQKKFDVMCRYLMVANDTFYSKFELDFDDGEVKVVDSIEISDIEFEEKFIDEYISNVYSAGMKSISGFMKVIYGDNDTPAKQLMEESEQEFKDFLDSLNG